MQQTELFAALSANGNLRNKLITVYLFFIGQIIVLIKFHVDY